VKVVFATETLAAGINMPARSTVIAAITRRGVIVLSCQAWAHMRRQDRLLDRVLTQE